MWSGVSEAKSSTVVDVNPLSLYQLAFAGVTVPLDLAPVVMSLWKVTGIVCENPIDVSNKVSNKVIFFIINRFRVIPPILRNVPLDAQIIHHNKKYTLFIYLVNYLHY
jgi:hypothetical protein